MKSAFHKIAAGLFLVTDFLVMFAFMLNCCFKEPKDAHPCAYAFAMIAGTFFLALAAFIALVVCALTFAAICTYPIWAAGIIGTIAVALTIGYGRRASRNWSKTK